MKRRQFIAGLGSAATWPLAVRAQQAAMPVVAFIGPLSEGASVRYVAAFRAGLGEVGYAEGRNVVISYHWLNGNYDHIPSIPSCCTEKATASPVPKARRTIHAFLPGPISAG